MSKAVQKSKAKSQALALANERDLDFMEAYGKHEAQQSNIVGQLLKFIKGDWYAGPDDDTVETGTEMIVNLDSMLLGWQRWEDEHVVDTDMGELCKSFQPKMRHELSFPPDADGKNEEWPTDDHGNQNDPWQFTNIVLMKAVDDGQLYTFSTGSKGGRSAIGKLLVTWSEKVREGEQVYPIVTLGAGCYKHRRYSRVDIPVLEIIDWSPTEDFGVEITDEPASTKAKTKPAAKPAAPARKALPVPKGKPMSQAGKGRNNSGSKSTRRGADDLSY